MQNVYKSTCFIFLVFNLFIKNTLYTYIFAFATLTIYYIHGRSSLSTTALRLTENFTDDL